jgi:hypothetical protein
MTVSGPFGADHPRGDPRREALEHRDELGRQAARRSARETRARPPWYTPASVRAVGRRIGEERKLAERRVTPTRRVQLRELGERERRLRDGAPRQLVALHRRRHVLHQEEKLLAAASMSASQTRGGSDGDGGRHLAIELDLFPVALLRGTRGAAHGIVGRELYNYRRWCADDRGRRVGRRAIPGEPAAYVQRDLARADALARDVDDGRLTGNAGGVQRLGEPARG